MPEPAPVAQPAKPAPAVAPPAPDPTKAKPARDGNARRAAIAQKFAANAKGNGAQTTADPAAASPAPAKAEPQKPAAQAAAPKPPEAAKAAEKPAAPEKPAEKAPEKPAEKPAEAWAQIKEMQAKLGHQERELKRGSETLKAERAEFSRQQAEFEKVRQAYAELDELRKTNPVEFAKRAGLKFQQIVDGAVEEGKTTPAEQKIQSLERQVQSLVTALKERDEAQQKREKEAETQATEEQKRQIVRNYHTQIRSALDAATAETFPYLAKIKGRKTDAIVQDAWDRLYGHYQETQVELPISTVLNYIETDLREEAELLIGSTTPAEAAKAAPPETDNGAGRPAKSVEEPAISQSVASASTSGSGKRLTREERERRAAARLRG